MMRRGNSARSSEDRETQLRSIRDLMLAAAKRGAWLTLGEIARLTDFGEASVSAQLRHLRKLQHGRHRVEKRVRRARRGTANVTYEIGIVGKRRAEGTPTIWEYRVLPPAGRGFSGRPDRIGARAHAREAAAQASFTESEDERCADVAGSMQQRGVEVSDAQARA
jgi:hypothetical protein